MIYERSGLLLPEPTEAPLDEGLIDDYEKAVGGTAEIYSVLQLPNERLEEVHQKIALGETPNYRAEHVDAVMLEQRLAALREFKDELLIRDDLEPDVQKFYRWKVNEDIANIHMVMASAAGDMKNFKRWAEFVYGKPDEDIYRAALDWIAHDADMLLADDSRSASVHEAASRVRDLLQDKRGYREILHPDPEVFAAVKEDHFREAGFFGLLLAGVDIPKEKITNEVGDPILRRLLQNIESQYDIADAAGASWGVVHSEGVVKRPAKINMPWQRFLGLGAGHEIGSHEIERINGLRGPLRLAAKGLDRYELGNEGRALTREEVPYETFDEFGKQVRWRDVLRRHIAISYGWGVGEDAPHSALEVSEFINTIDTMYQTRLTPNDASVTSEKANAKTNSLLDRVLKGTDGTGFAYPKDKVYLEGHVAVWLEAALHGPEVVSDGDLAKFAINFPRHIAGLQRLGLLPVRK